MHYIDIDCTPTFSVKVTDTLHASEKVQFDTSDKSGINTQVFNHYLSKTIRAQADVRNVLWTWPLPAIPQNFTQAVFAEVLQTFTLYGS